MTERTRSAAFEAFMDAVQAEADPLFVQPAKSDAPKPNPIERQFEEILAFVDRNGREPDGVASRDPQEVMLAARLSAYRRSSDRRNALASFDRHDLLKGEPIRPPSSLDELIAAGDDLLATPEDDIFSFRHAPDRSAKAEPDRIAARRPCRDYDSFRPLFRRVVEEINAGVRRTQATNATNTIAAGDFFIVDGHLAYVASVDEVRTRQGDGKQDARLRVIYDNVTESDHLMLSFSKALYRDANARRVTPPDGDAGGLFAAGEDLLEGHVYLARTLSADPAIAPLAGSMIKIGSSINDPSKRIGGAAKDPTFLLADARIIATCTVRGIHPRVVEKGLHAFFAAANVSITMPDRFGNGVDAREWFLVGERAILDAVGHMQDRALARYAYDLRADRVVPLDGRDDRPKPV